LRAGSTPASSSACQAHSRNSRCCGSIDSASRGEKSKNGASSRSISARSAAALIHRGSAACSGVKPAARTSASASGRIDSTPAHKFAHSASASAAPGKRPAKPTIATSSPVVESAAADSAPGSRFSLTDYLRTRPRIAGSSGGPSRPARRSPLDPLPQPDSPPDSTSPEPGRNGETEGNFRAAKILVPFEAKIVTLELTIKSASERRRPRPRSRRSSWGALRIPAFGVERHLGSVQRSRGPRRSHPYKEYTQEPFPPMTDLARTWRQAVRGLARTPALTLAAIASFALGIGANTLIFTFLNALFLSPLPVTDPSRLVAIYSTDPDNPGFLPTSQPNAVDLREQVTAFSGLAAIRATSVALLDGGEPETVPAELVSGNYFTVLGLKPAHGRFFLPEEDAAPGSGTAVVLSQALWRRRFGGEPALVGKTIRINGRPLTVAGIAPAGFGGLSLIDEPPQLWIPLSLAQQIVSGPQAKGLLRRGGRQLALVARLKPGVTIASARGALDAAARDLARIHPDENRDLGLAAVPLSEATIPQALRGRLVKAGALLAAVVGLLLLVAGANVANLLLARALSRDRETAVRLALGARRGQLARLLLTEGLALALAGGAAGLLLASWGRDLLWRLRPPFFPESLAPHLDAKVLGFTFAVSLATGLLFGLAPLAGSLRTDLAAALGNAAAAIGSGGYGGRRGPGSLRALLVGAQVAI